MALVDGQIYAATGADGSLQGFYVGGKNTSIPFNVVAISDAQHQQWLATPSLLLVNGALQAGPAAAVTAAQQPQIRAQLATLDMSIPRGLEDGWTASGFDTTKLPQMTQDKLAEKHALRARLAALITAGTP